MRAGIVSGGGIAGRRDELAAIAASAVDAVAGRPWVVWIEGEAGSGKTALLRAALNALPEEFTVLAAEAEELAGDFPYHVVQQLGVGAAAAAFPAGLELLEIWGRAQEAGPVAVTVEDLHWADSGSRLALLAAVRRLGHDRVLVLVTSRPEPVGADGWERLCFDPDRCLRVPLGPLLPAEVAEMARHSGVRLSFGAAERLCRHAGGHPLYIRTLLGELPPEQLTAGDGELPAPRSLALTTVARIAELPPDARALAAAVAVVNQRTPLPAAAAVAGISQPARALDDLLGTGFVTSRASGQLLSLEYVHPLYRAAVYADVTPTRRQEMHRRAADLAGGDAALVHRVAAADSADDVLADQAEEAAWAEAARQQLTLAARDLLWASELSSRPGTAQGRLLRAARLLLAAGQARAVEELQPRIEACSPGALRSLVLGVLARDQADAAAAEHLLAEAAAYASSAESAGPAAGAEGAARGGDDAADTTGVQADALSQLAGLYINKIRVREGLDAADRALALRPKQPEVKRAALFAAAFGATLSSGAQAGLGRLAECLPERVEDVTAPEVDLLAIRGSLEFWAGRLTAATRDLRAVVRLAHHSPALNLPMVHARLSQVLFEAGNWDEALLQAHVALSLAPGRESSMVEAEAHVAIACVRASRGEWAPADEHIAMAQALAAEVNATGEAEAMIRIAHAAGARARGERAGVISAIGPMAGLADVQTPELAVLRQARLLGLGILWWPMLIEALLDSGETELAARQLGELQAVVAERHLSFACPLLALQACLSAATGQSDLAMAHFSQAAGLAGPDDPLLDRALLHHAFGRLLHARGDRRGAVDQLRQAHELLTGVGAQPFAARVAADLAAAGMPVAVQGRGSPLALTGREADVVALVAKGMTNSEVAAELYVSTNTVEYHLRNVFAKLGISSRRELRKFAR